MESSRILGGLPCCDDLCLSFLEYWSEVELSRSLIHLMFDVWVVGLISSAMKNYGTTPRL